MKLSFWRKNFTNCSKVRVGVGPYFADLWKHDASRLWEWYEQRLCSLKMQMDVNTQILHIWKTFSLGNVMAELGALADVVPCDFIPAHHQITVTFIPNWASFNTLELDWPAWSLVLYKTGLGFSFPFWVNVHLDSNDFHVKARIQLPK